LYRLVLALFPVTSLCQVELGRLVAEKSICLLAEVWDRLARNYILRLAGEDKMTLVVPFSLLVVSEVQMGTQITRLEEAGPYTSPVGLEARRRALLLHMVEV
jgi:hypothetical protein